MSDSDRVSQKSPFLGDESGEDMKEIKANTAVEGESSVPPTDVNSNSNSHVQQGPSGEPSFGSTPRPNMQLTSDEVNIIIYRYLQEAGFVHAAFTFAHESMIGQSSSSKSNVPPGALISFLQKGLQYIGIEETLRLDGSDNPTAISSDHLPLELSLLCPQTLKSLSRKDPPIKINVPPATAAAAIKARLEQQPMMNVPIAMLNSFANIASSGGNLKSNGAAMLLNNKSGRSKAAANTSRNNVKNHGTGAAVSKFQSDEEIDREDKLTRTDPSDVLELNKHTSEVFMCAWNPVYTNLLATGSGDASARIWRMGGKEAKDGPGTCILLHHGTDPTDTRNKDVTTLEWSSNGELLATGSYDGVARVWDRSGNLLHTLRGHLGPIFSLKWNKKGNFLLSGSYDKTTIVWNVSGENGVIEQQFHDHAAPALDVDWKDDLTFASCSTDKSVLICRVGSSKPLHRYTGHKDEVNAVKWDPSGTLLASCSDDSTAKVWDVSSNSNLPLHDFTTHNREIYTVKW
jgi:transducin (beta)-like 1